MAKNNNQVDMEKVAYEMFNNLFDHINEKVVIETWNNGRLNRSIETLKDITIFDSIKVDKKGYNKDSTKSISFISNNNAIKSIKLLENNEILYVNNYVRKGYGKEKEDVEKIYKRYFW